MPYPRRVDKESIVRAAHELVEQEGVGALSLDKLARLLGIKAPSLYRHVGNKESLLLEVNLLTLRQLFFALDVAVSDAKSDPTDQLLAVMQIYRHFAHTHPYTYMMAMTTKPGAGRPDEDALVQMVLPLQALMEEVSGKEESLAALRGAFALVHGYVMLELNQQLQRGGDLDATFDRVVRAYLAGWKWL